MLWLCIQFPKLSLETLTRALTSGERSQALAIVENHIIVQSNNAALEFGISPGLSTRSARIRCPNLQMLQRHKEREQRQLEALAQWGHSFTPMVSLKAASPEEGSHPPRLYLELSDCLKTHGGLRTLLNQLEKELIEIGISYYLGLGHSPSAALLLSQLAEHRQWLQQTNAPPTTGQCKQWIGHAPCKLLECDNQTIEKLYKYGYKRIGQLLPAPLSELEAHFGCAFIDYLAQLTGSLQKPVSYQQLPAHLNNELYFPKAFSKSEQLLFPCIRLLQEPSQQLQRCGDSTQQTHCQLKGEMGQMTSFNLELYTKFEMQELITQTKFRLDALSFSQPIRLLQLYCSRLPIETQEEWGGYHPEDVLKDKVIKSQKLIEKLKNRLGYQTLTSIKFKKNF
ncbi:DNA polymerase Y family protein [Microbulbifer echini]|uniref:DNA polymerase Y family protein n=1 Tax=Microbulbifer echini TaxID=1529067 RepID=A0ABV4NM36_9GAMM